MKEFLVFILILAVSIASSLILMGLCSFLAAPVKRRMTARTKIAVHEYLLDCAIKGDRFVLYNLIGSVYVKNCEDGHSIWLEGEEIAPKIYSNHRNTTPSEIAPLVSKAEKVDFRGPQHTIDPGPH